MLAQTIVRGGRIGFASAAVCFALATVHAAPGDLDPSFAGSGIALTPFGGGEDEATSVALQADGKLLVAGFSGWLGGVGGESNFAVVRYNVDHSLDSLFGSEGKIVFPVGIDSSWAHALGVQPDQKIVLAGEAYQISDDGWGNLVFAVMRLNANGEPDDSFGTEGIVMSDVGSMGSLTSMLLLADGGILVAGTADDPSTTATRLVMARYQSTGVLDPSFGSAGIVSIAKPGGVVARALAVQTDGKILVAGTANGHMAVFRFLPDGTPDPTFDTDGIAAIPIGTTSTATAINLQFGDGSTLNPDTIVVAGSSTTHAITSFAVARLQLDGTPDPTFSADGNATTRIGADVEGAHSVMIQGSMLTGPRILVAGFCSTPTAAGFRRNMAVVRYLPNGSLDPAFDGDGIAITPIGAKGHSTARAMIMHEGKLLVAGHAQSGPGPKNSDFAMVRYDPDSGALDPAYDGDGIKVEELSNSSAEAHAVAIQRDGKIITAGFAHHSNRDEGVAALARYLQDGSLDSTFGAAGKVLIDAGTVNSTALDLAIQSDGKIVIVCRVLREETRFLLARLRSEGSPDTTFGDKGFVDLSIFATSVAVQSDGKIVVSGNRLNGANTDIGVARYNDDGSPDNTFNGTGSASADFSGGEDSAVAMRIQADGKIVAAGLSGNRIAVVRFLNSGLLDPSFGNMGKVMTGFGTRAFGRALAIQSDNKIIVAGLAKVDDGPLGMALVRYLPDGRLDTSFDGDGKVITLGGTYVNTPFDVAVQTNGKIVIGGVASFQGNPRPAVFRHLPNGAVDLSFGTSGKVVIDPISGFSIAYGIALDENGRAVIALASSPFHGVARFLGDPLPNILAITRLPNGQALLQGSGQPNGNHLLHASSTLDAGSFLPITPVIPDQAGLWQYLDEEATTLDQRFYRISP